MVQTSDKKKAKVQKSEVKSQKPEKVEKAAVKAEEPQLEAKSQKPPARIASSKADVGEEASKAEKRTTAVSTDKKPQTMEELLAQSTYTLAVPQKGDKVSGKISAITRKSLIIDIGAKTEAVVADKEFDIAREFVSDLKVGDTIEAHVLSTENDKGQILLSLKKAAVDSKWDRFIEAFEKDETISVKGLEVNKGGLIVSVDGVRGFVPSSQFGKQYIGSFQRLKGQDLDVKVIEVDKEKNRLIFSERHVSEATQLAQRDQALAAVKAGEIYNGVVSGVMPFGLFVTVEVPVDGSSGFVEGLVHISEISWEKVSHPKDYHQVGDEMKVRVMGIDENTGKLNLSIKQLSEDPWKETANEFPIGTVFTGHVSRIESFGVFVNVKPGVDGLIHTSKLDPSSQLAEGEEVVVSVESIDPDQRRMSLSPVLHEVPVGYK